MKRIILLLIPVFILILAFNYKPDHIVSGKITDGKKKPVSGVSIVEKGTTNGTTTNDKGEFSLKVSSPNAILVIECIGYEPQELSIDNQTNVSIILKKVNNAQQEVVIVAYAQKKKSFLSPNFQSVNTKSLPAIYGSTSSNQLSGMAPGISINGDVASGYRGNPDTTFNTESYDHITENRFLRTTDNPFSTFSIDVDAASYSNVRRFLNEGMLPPAGAVRIEEMINYFKYEYEDPGGNDPFRIYTEMSVCPWNNDHRLVMIGLQGKKIPVENLPPSNLVFLIDVSGSMDEPAKLPLVKASMRMLTDQLREQDKVAIVVYAGAAGLVLPSTSGAEKGKIINALDKLEAGGSTAGGAGINLAYKIARNNFMKEGNNRVILCTDGDFNIGASSDDEMERLIERERKSGVFLTVLGFGTGNYKDSKMQKLADKGNGNHAYIDGISEAKKVLVNEFGGTIFTIAKDVKLQVEFNPTRVGGYRLMGYENRMLDKEDFDDDKKDAGELGSGHTVTALYEVIPAGVESSFLDTTARLRYQSNDVSFTAASASGEMMNIKVRYKAPDSDISKLIEHPVQDNSQKIENTTSNFRFAAAVAEFGLLLRNSSYKSNATFEQVISLAKKAKAEDKEGYRAEFLKLVRKASLLVLKKEEEDIAVSDKE